MSVSSSSESVTTVLGSVSVTDLGVTLTHEHCLIDLRPYCSIPSEVARRAIAESPIDITNIGLSRRNPFLKLDNLLQADPDVAASELMEFRKLGGGTVVDLTLPDIGRDAEALKIISRVTGLHIIAGCGHYIQIAHPSSLQDEPVESITERLLKELQEGIDDTEVRPGIIGEIGTSCPIHKNEEKVLRAAGRAHKATGVAIAIHLSPAPRVDGWMGHEVLNILESEGVSLNRVLLSHLDNMLEPGGAFEKALAHHRALSRRGCFIGYDGCGKDHYFPTGSRAAFPSFWCPSDRERAKAVASLIDSGAESQLLLSHDVCFKVELTRYGGFGYGHILRTFSNNLRDYGVGSTQIHRLLVENPARLLIPGT
jgi:phosphotriesterase-related protein